MPLAKYDKDAWLDRLRYRTQAKFCFSFLDSQAFNSSTPITWLLSGRDFDYWPHNRSGSLIGDCLIQVRLYLITHLARHCLGPLTPSQFTSGVHMFTVFLKFLKRLRFVISTLFTTSAKRFSPKFQTNSFIFQMPSMSCLRKYYVWLADDLTSKFHLQLIFLKERMVLSMTVSQYFTFLSKQYK